MRVRRARSSIAPRDLIDRAARSTIAPRDLVDRAGRSTIAPRDLVDRRSRRRDRRSLFSLSLSDLGFLFSLSLSLSLSLFFRKSFEVKMRGETDFRVKGEKIGQPEVIFLKMIFSGK